jgi:hypothetical protein
MTTQFSILPEVRATPGDEDGSVVINLESGKVFSLNGAGAKVWAMLEEGLTFEGVINSLAREYDVSRQQVQADLEIFISALECKGLVEASDAAGLTRTEEPTNGITA